MTLQKINQLFLHNIKEINKLNIAFGSGDQTMVVTLGRALSLTVTDTTLEIRHAK